MLAILTAIIMTAIQPVELTPRWTALPRIQPIHLEYFRSDARFIVVPAGRRSYKTEIGKRKLVMRALRSTTRGAWYIAAGPTRDQAKRIFWEDIKSMVPKEFIAGRPSESQLTIDLVNSARLAVMGMDRPERVEGILIGGLLLDEYANMHEHTWSHHVRPALSDPSLTQIRPFAWFIGVPEGRNHYYDLYLNALSDDSGLWKVYEWKSALVIDPAEIEEARRSLDPMTYEQEYEGTFVSVSGKVYYPFDTRTHASQRLSYNETRDLILMLDFNVAPGVAAVAQEQPHPNVANATQTQIIREIWRENDSNTPMICNDFIRLFGYHKGDVYVYGDATGGARETSAVMGSDWDLVRKILGAHFGSRLKMRVKRHNPSVRARINAVNSRLRSMDNEIHMLVDPDCAPHVVRDFDGVVWDDRGVDIKKESSSNLTHLTDAIGYYCEYRYPVRAVYVSASQNL